MPVRVFEGLEVFDDQLVALDLPLAFAAGDNYRDLRKRDIPSEPAIDAELVGKRLVTGAVAVRVDPFDGNSVRDRFVFFEQRLDICEVLLVPTEEDVDLDVLIELLQCLLAALGKREQAMGGPVPALVMTRLDVVQQNDDHQAHHGGEQEIEPHAWLRAHPCLRAFRAPMLRPTAKTAIERSKTR